MAALLKLLQPGDPVFAGRYTVEEVLGGHQGCLLARLADQPLVLRDYPAPDPSLESLREVFESRAKLEHPNLLPVVECCWEEGRFRVLQPDLDGSNLENVARWQKEQVSAETWLKTSLQLGRLLSFLKDHCQGPLLDLELSDLLLVDGKVYLAERGWSQLPEHHGDPKGEAERHYLAQFSKLTEDLLQALEDQSRSTTALAWAVKRRYGSFSELLQSLRDEIDRKEDDPAEISPLENFEIPELDPLPSASELFFRQRPVYLFAEFCLVGILLFAAAYLLLRPPPTVPPKPLYLQTASKILVYDADRYEVEISWPARHLNNPIARSSPAVLVAMVPGSSQLVELDGATGKERNRVLLPTPVSPSRLLSTEQGFVAIAPGRAILGTVDSEAEVLRVTRAVPASRNCRAAVSAGENLYLADETMLRRYHLDKGSILAETRLPAVSGLVKLSSDLAVLQAASKQIVLVHPETLENKGVLSIAPHEPQDLFPLSQGRGLLLTTAGLLAELDLAKGSVSTLHQLPRPVKSGVSAYGKLWLVDEEGQLSTMDLESLKLNPVALNQPLTGLIAPR